MQVDQPMQIGEFLFLTFFYGLIVYFFLINTSILVMHFLMPKEVLERYFKPPYFREFECKFFSGIPYAPIRTVMFMRVIAFPNSGNRRGITEAHKMVPQWYCISSRVTLVTLVTGFGLIMLYLLGVGVSLVIQ